MVQGVSQSALIFQRRQSLGSCPSKFCAKDLAFPGDPGDLHLRLHLPQLLSQALTYDA